MLPNSRPDQPGRGEMVSRDARLPTAPPGDKCLTEARLYDSPFLSYAEFVERMTWLKRKSHRSSAPPSGQGRDGARPQRIAAAVPYAGPTAGSQDAGEAPTAPAPDHDVTPGPA